MGASLSRAWLQEADGALSPSPFSATMSGKLMCTNFREISGLTGNEGRGKTILVICTGENRLRMANGAVFATGHNPTELFVPLYHLQKAGFEIQICTPDAKPVTVEEWALPATQLGGYEEPVQSTMKALRRQLDSPNDVKDIPRSLQGYAGLFIPGGHGPMVNLHENKDVGVLLLSAHEKGVPTAALCHGPNALRSTMTVTDSFPYAGYKICCFTDRSDTAMYWMHYLPGPMPTKIEAPLRSLGAIIPSKDLDTQVVQDRELITATCHRGSQELAEKFLQVLTTPFQARAF